MAFIDPKISETAIDDNERAVITKYDFEVRDKGGQFEVLDAIVRKANRGKGGKHSGGNLGICLSAAVAERQAHEKAVAAAPKGKGKAATKAEQPAQPEVQPEPEPENDPEADAREEQAIQDAGQGDGEAGASTADSGENDPAEPAETNKPGTEIEVSEEDLDNTGKRERKSRKEEKGPRKDNRYLRAAKIVVGDLSIDAESLAGKADMSTATAGHCLEAWRGVVAALLEQNMIAPKHVAALRKSVSKG